MVRVVITTMDLVVSTTTVLVITGVEEWLSVLMGLVPVVITAVEVASATNALFDNLNSEAWSRQ